MNGQKNSLILLLVFISLLFSGASFGEVPKDYDLVYMKSGTVIEGCLISETDLLITIESPGGSVSVPQQTVDKIVKARPGESQLMLGLHLLDQKKLDRAERLLKKASVFTEWRDAVKEAQKRLDDIKLESDNEQKTREQNDIENLIRRDGLQAGINALEKRYRNPENADDEYWGDVRGRLHLMMARDRIDHLDLKEAERQLALAEKLGADPVQWEAVRKELLETRRESVLLGPNALAAKKFEGKQKKKRNESLSSPFLAAVQDAQQRGEKVPPLEFLSLVDRYAQANELDPLLVWALIDTESAWQIDAVSSKGAQGLMQLMPTTAKELDVSNPFNPEENIRGGTAYMRFLLEMFSDVDTALAAYNVGPGRVERTGVPPAGKRYIDKIRKRFASLQERFSPALASS